MKNLKEQIENTKISVPAEHNPLIQEALNRINQNHEIKTLWSIINVNAIDRLKMTDHGPVHFQIVANIALRIARILKKNNVSLSVENNYELSTNHGELVILLAALFHDLGMTINREGHEEFSLILADRLLVEVLDFMDPVERTIIHTETLHAIISHRKGGTPYTLEAGIVRVADALDMAEGRSRITFEVGNVDIHSLSHNSIDKVSIEQGVEKPIVINITMNNSAGLFQVDELLKKKIKGSGLEKYVAVNAKVTAETEKSHIKEFHIE